MPSELHLEMPFELSPEMHLEVHFEIFRELNVDMYFNHELYGRSIPVGVCATHR